jgi:hypothetical protein
MMKVTVISGESIRQISVAHSKKAIVFREEIVAVPFEIRPLQNSGWVERETGLCAAPMAPCGRVVEQA